MNPSEDIRDIKAPVPLDLPLPAWVWAAAALAVAAAALLGWWWWRRSRPRAAVVRLAAHDVALAALDGLRGLSVADRAVAQRYHFELSAIVRAYVEGRFALNATDLTSEEILARLGAIQGLSDGDRGRLHELLLTTDRVKFASHAPTPDECSAAWELARAFVLSTLATQPSDPAGAQQPEAARA